MSAKAKTNLKRYARYLLGVLLLVGLAGGGFLWHLIAHHNFHIVSAGRIYRSGQMDATGFTQTVREQNIKSILNLRGVGKDQDWYEEETRTARQLNVEHYDIALSAGHEVDDAQIDRILETINHAPKPMLIHCRNGSDRTGLVGALYLYSIEGKSADESGRELNIFYGHIPYLFWRDTIAMDRSFWRYVNSHGGPARTESLSVSASFHKEDRSAGDVGR